MIIKHFFTPELSINSYLIYDEKEKLGAIIDSAKNTADYLSFASLHKIKITDILETHVHADFLSGALDLKKSLNNSPKIHCSGMGKADWIPDYCDRILKDGDEILIGSIRLKALHTPGHTIEHMCFEVFDDENVLSSPKAIFTGDLLFLGGIGRPDLLGIDAMQDLIKMLYESIFEKIYVFDDSVEVYPSHGAGSLCGKKISPGIFSTIGKEKISNPGLTLRKFEEWKNMLMEGMPNAPKYFKMMKMRNLKGLNIENKLPQQIHKNNLEEEQNLNVIIDIRDPNSFAKASFKDSINIPFGPSFTLWAGSVLEFDKPLLLVGKDVKSLKLAIHALELIGFNQNLKYFSLEEFDENEKSLNLIGQPVIDVNTLYKNKENYYVLDVRTKNEWDQSHIIDAKLLPLNELTKKIHSIPKDKAVAVICHSGNRASVAASLISKELGILAINVTGGMLAWINQALPIERS